MRKTAPWTVCDRTREEMFGVIESVCGEYLGKDLNEKYWIWNPSWSDPDTIILPTLRGEWMGVVNSVERDIIQTYRISDCEGAMVWLRTMRLMGHKLPPDAFERLETAIQEGLHKR